MTVCPSENFDIEREEVEEEDEISEEEMIKMLDDLEDEVEEVEEEGGVEGEVCICIWHQGAWHRIASGSIASHQETTYCGQHDGELRAAERELRAAERERQRRRMKRWKKYRRRKEGETEAIPFFHWGRSSSQRETSEEP